MAAFFGNRPSYVTASWANQRIYPRTEPSFAEPTPTSPRRTSSSSQAFPPVSRTFSSPPSRPTTTSDPSTTTTSDRPVQPPPLYFPGANRQRSLSQSSPSDPLSSSSLPPNHIPSINSASTRLSIVPWFHHPIPLVLSSTEKKPLGVKLKKWLRLPEIWTCLKQVPEVLHDGWPVEFGGKPMEQTSTRTSEDEESDRLSRFSSRRSGNSRADSGIVLPRRSSTQTTTTNNRSQQQQQHVLEPLYKKRIQELNTLISEGLVLSRGWLALTELMWIVWFLALIVALGQGKGVQTGFLKGVEIGLVCVIILSALAINGVRMRRWALAEQLRKRTRDWSPLPITSSTNAQLMRNYLDGDADPREINGVTTGNGNGSGTVRYKESPVLRWRLREIEGGYWIAYRPIIRCELITPATRSNPHMIVNPQDQPDSIEVGDESLSAVTPGGDEEAAGAMGELPPGYEEDQPVRRRE
ncbi:hypothetical protein JCM16303_004636 [Sporobolomyces ruberrimus]